MCKYIVHYIKVIKFTRNTSKLNEQQMTHDDLQNPKY